MVRCSREVLFSVRLPPFIFILSPCRVCVPRRRGVRGEKESEKRVLICEFWCGQAFERLVELRVFLPAAAPAASIAREFALHRSAVDRFEVKKAVDAIGQLNLKKWFTKA